jgi:hypothetical protein
MWDVMGLDVEVCFRWACLSMTVATLLLKNLDKSYHDMSYRVIPHHIASCIVYTIIVV